MSVEAILRFHISKGEGLLKRSLTHVFILFPAFLPKHKEKPFQGRAPSSRCALPLPPQAGKLAAARCSSHSQLRVLLLPCLPPVHGSEREGTTPVERHPSWLGEGGPGEPARAGGGLRCWQEWCWGLSAAGGCPLHLRLTASSEGKELRGRQQLQCLECWMRSRV